MLKDWDIFVFTCSLYIYKKKDVAREIERDIVMLYDM
jgi:hypothetical protein